MALFGNFGNDTKTGNGFLDKIANFTSYVPIIGGALTFPIGMIGTALEAGKWLFQGKVASAVTVLASGTVGNLVNSIPGVSWWVNDVLGVTVGANAGTLARGLTESVVGGGMHLLGQNPTVLASYPAGIGSINGGFDATSRAPQASFRDQVAAERGMSREQIERADQAYVNNFQSGAGLGA